MKLATIIFCDGACSGNPGPGGWGAIIAVDDEVREMTGRESRTTNNQMELRAAIEALKGVNGIAGEVVVYTDSKYVINGITKWIYGWLRNGWKSSQGGAVLNQEFWKELHSVVLSRGKDNPVRWCYVPGHSNVAGNERVDLIAVSSAKGEGVSLYRGSRESYPVDLTVPTETFSVESSSSSKKRKSSGQSVYLSLIGTIPMRHATWADCERRVKGQPKAKYKKIQSTEEELAVWKSWGVDPSKVK